MNPSAEDDDDGGLELLKTSANPLLTTVTLSTMPYISITANTF